MSDEGQERQRRAAMKQSLCRRVNEATIQRLSGSAGFIEVACECSQTTCAVPLTLSVEEYEQIRREPTHFVVAPGHIDPKGEWIVEQTSRYVVVEKIELGAKVAATLDPRRYP